MIEPSGFLPTNANEMRARGWDAPDFVYVIGDAYVDHPSFGSAILSRLLEREGFKVAMLAQPDLAIPHVMAEFGMPRLGFLVSAGNMDSMVNHYTVAKKRRKKDAYSPGGVMGKRPDRAVIAYAQAVRGEYPDTAIIIGGIEASLRRFAHYDYWSDGLMRSVLLDSGADVLSYGMGEHSILEIAEALRAGLQVQDLTFIDGTVFCAHSLDHVYDYDLLPSWDELHGAQAKHAFARSFAQQYANLDPVSAHRLVEPYPDDVYVVQNPPAAPLTTSEMDAIYRLPYMRAWHPTYDEAGGIPALAEVQFSLTSSRGCFGECSFCALTFHQGRHVSARSHESVLEEAELLTHHPSFKGYIHDVGGPTANFRQNACAKVGDRGACVNRRCLGSEPCSNIVADHADYTSLLRKIRAIPHVKKVFVRSGIRYDFALLDRSSEFLEELVEHHVSGQLKVAPEHVSDRVLRLMGKPPVKVYHAFAKRFKELTKRCGKKQYLVPYLMSSHPGSTLEDAVELAEFVRDMGYNPEQVQDFYPTPGTLSTAMYYTGMNPLTGKHVHIPKDPHEKAMQRALIQYRNPKNARLVREALKRAHREDLIGSTRKCLIKRS